MPYCVAIVDYQLGIRSACVRDFLEIMAFLLDEVEKETGVICKTANELNAALLEIGKEHF